jgi:hypothetical protein
MDFRSLFTPLGSEYCDYFYILSVFFFVLFVITTITVLMQFFGKRKLKLSESVILITQPLMLYFINRLYYSMCAGSLV